MAVRHLSFDSVIRNRLLHVSFIALVGFLAYSNTFHVPFQWDEITFIVRNPIVKDLNYFVHPSAARGMEGYAALRSRYIGYLTFALDYRIHGADVTGYHVVNLFIHIMTSVLVYLFFRLLFRTPFMRPAGFDAYADIASLSGALLFVSHPIQTEAVTYIFQRLASLAAMFYLLSIVLYMMARGEMHAAEGMGEESDGSLLRIVRVFKGNGSASLVYYLLSLICAVLAMKTKENAFTLPIVITLLEILFFEGSPGVRIIRLLPLFLTMLVIPLTLAGGHFLGSVENLPSLGAQGGMMWKDYFFTQFRVIVTYIRLLFFPINQNIDYDYPTYTSFFDKEVILSFFLLFSIVLLAVYSLYRSRSGSRLLRLVGFGILWFFITLSIESSVIPINMIIDEYRVYLPSVGAIIAVIAGVTTAAKPLMKQFPTRDWRKTGTVMVLVMVLIFSVATYARNVIWGDEATLWEDVVKKSPEKARGYTNLAAIYGERKQYDKALAIYSKLLKIGPYDENALGNLAGLYYLTGRPEEAISLLKKALRINSGDARIYYRLGIIYSKQGDHAQALENLQKACSLGLPDACEAAGK